VIWQTPTQDGVDTLTVVVSDGEHSVVGNQPVALVGLAPPDSLKFVLGASIADLHWQKSADDGIDLWRGYEVYQATHSLQEAPADSLLRYRVTPAPLQGGQDFRATNLVRGVRYYFRVAGVRSWDTGSQRSPFSGEVDLSPRPTALNDLNEIVQAEHSGWALDLSGLVVRAFDPSDTSRMRNLDLYLGTSDPEDGPGALTLKSVSKLQYVHPGWANRRVRIKPAGTDWNINTTTDDGWQEEALLQEEVVYVVRLPEGNYAKLHVTRLYPGSWPRRLVVIQWAYQLIPDYPNF
jgi:hypothetical protein